jgi:hypothetical protein
VSGTAIASALSGKLATSGTAADVNVSGTAISGALSGKAPTSHAANASTYGYGDATNAGHLRVGTGLGVTAGTISVTYGTAASTSCQGNDSRLSDLRYPPNGSAQYAFITSGASPFAAAWSAAFLNGTSGKTFTWQNSITLSGTDATVFTMPTVTTSIPMAKVTAVTAGATIALTWSSYTVATWTVGQAEAITCSGGISGAFYSCVITAAASGYILTFGSGFKVNGTLTTPGSAGKIVTILFVNNGGTMTECSRIIAGM